MPLPGLAFGGVSSAKAWSSVPRVARRCADHADYAKGFGLFCCIYLYIYIYAIVYVFWILSIQYYYYIHVQMHILCLAFPLYSSATDKQVPSLSLSYSRSCRGVFRDALNVSQFPELYLNTMTTVPCGVLQSWRLGERLSYKAWCPSPRTPAPLHLHTFQRNRREPRWAENQTEE